MMSKLKLNIKAYKKLSKQNQNLAVYLIAFLEDLGLIKIIGGE
jgi:hypothetical protein